MKTTDDLKLNDTVWRDRAYQDPEAEKVTGINRNYIEVSGYDAVRQENGTTLKSKSYSGFYYLNKQDALLNQYQHLQKAAKEAQKKVVLALAEVDSILEQKDKLVFEINEQASIKLDWLDAKKMAQDTDELINPL